MEKKNNRGIIILMGVIIGVLLVLCVLFATDTITFNKKNNTTSNEDATTTKDTSDINQTSSDKITGEKIVGNYTFEECIDGEANADGTVSACWDYKLKIENINISKNDKKICTKTLKHDTKQHKITQTNKKRQIIQNYNIFYILLNIKNKQ